MAEKRILVADDDVEDRFVMEQTFEELGYASAISFFEDGVHLLSWLDEHGASGIGLIVLDLNMPRLNGTETLRQLKAHIDYQAVPVIIFSTSVNEIERDSCMKLGAADYVTKPSQYADFVSTCKRFFNLSADHISAY